MFHDGHHAADHRPAHDDAPGESGDEPPSSRSRASGSRASAWAGTEAPESPDDPIEVGADPGVRIDGLSPEQLRSLTRVMRERVRAVVAVLEVPVDRLSVRLVDDATMTGLHRRHCDLDGTTDVLSFPAAAPGEPVDADIACCVDEAARQAGRRGHPVADELLLYAVHGLLHCLGHDDHEPEAYAAMHAEEDRVLTAIGVGARFATAERTADGAEPAAAPLESPGVDS